MAAFVSAAVELVAGLLLFVRVYGRSWKIPLARPFAQEKNCAHRELVRRFLGTQNAKEYEPSCGCAF